MSATIGSSQFCTNYPDRMDPAALNAIERQASDEIAATVTTSAMLDGTARQRRDLRILARRLNGIAAKYGVTLEQAIRQAQASDRPIVVTLDMADSAVEPVAVSTPADVVAPAAVTAVQVTDTADTSRPVPAATADSVTATAAIPAPVFGATKRTGRKARRAAARRANLDQVA